ncbi:hypothetical protein LUZ62_088048 [Rhynchospora pubera]|uniref:C3H1-type domain-containing protein n=1 Tax=Rhynchospora pubera TaxID=906938 RepID=A0AAV8CCP6_9POAL|nr:hypothetical protein LUZ62_088048 [Rhynchospora pubera]
MPFALFPLFSFPIALNDFDLRRMASLVDKVRMERIIDSFPAAILQLLTGNHSFEIKRHTMLLEIQQKVNLYNETFARLRKTLSDVEVLRRENLDLTAANLQFKYLVTEREKVAPRGMTSKLKGKDKEVRVERSDLTPPSGSDSGEGSGETRVNHPKSISIRSRGFLTGETGGQPQRLRVRTPGPGQEEGEEGEVEVEMEVFSQGMEKTELCNKWRGPGGDGCPFGDQCRFAHGVEELRPVLRHPRYKTQVCRMYGTDTGCPYGHRCHFKHVGPGEFA